MSDKDAAPTQTEAHGEFPLPSSWAQAWPILLWGMLALALAFLIADSLGELVVNPLYRAASAAVALMTITAMVIYRRPMLEKFRNPSAGVIVGALGILIFAIVSSRFIQEQRWPFSSATYEAPYELQRVTESLQQALRERDQSNSRTEVSAKWLGGRPPDSRSYAGSIGRNASTVSRCRSAKSHLGWMVSASSARA